MQIARRICLPWWSFLLICAAAMAITALVVYEATTEPEPEAPVSYSFQPETGALTFYIPEGWELLRVFTDEGALTIPPYHQNTRSSASRRKRGCSPSPSLRSFDNPQGESSFSTPLRTS